MPEPLPENLRYQLLRRAASAVIEAKRFGAGHAVMLVYSFSQSDAWLDDYYRFAALFDAQASANAVSALGRAGGIAFYGAWVRGETRYLEA